MEESRSEGGRESRRHQAGGALSTLLGGALLVLVGFAAGLVVGASFEDPDLLAHALAGNTTDVSLSEASSPGAPASEPAVAPAPAPLGEHALEGSTRPAPPPRVAARARSAAPSPPAARSPRGAFSVQVGAFQDEGPARRLVKHLEGRGFDAFVVSEGRSGPWRVRVGPVATRDEADSLAHNLKRGEGLPTWVVSDD